MQSQYKFEKFRFPDFPVYTSVQKGAGVLASPHFHKAAELILVLEGECEIGIDATVLQAKPQDVFFIPPHCVHVVMSHREDTKIKGLTFEPSLLRTAPEDTWVEAALSKESVEEYRLRRNTETLRQCLADFSLEGQQDTARWRLAVLSDLYQIGAILLENVNPTRKEASRGRIKPVVEYIKKNYPYPIRISDLSALINVCDSHLIRLFRSATHRTPVEYINDLRLEEALKLLMDETLSVSEIADRVGVSNANYMIRLFKSKLHTTPGGYRKGFQK